MCTGAEIGLILGGLGGAAGGIKALTTPGPDTGAMEARQAAALEEQKKATAAAKAAADSNSEAARLASEARLKRLTGAGAFGAAFSGGFAPAPVGYRTAFGQ